MNRRVFLAALSGLTSLFLLRRSLASDGDAATRALLGLFSSPDDARAVGRRYLAQYPGKADQAVLLRELGEELTAPAARNDPALRQLVGARQRRDFARGDTVLLDNWILSRTEVSLCALAALC